MFNRDEGLLMVAGVGATLRPLFNYTHPTGSNYTCNPPVTNTDIDIYVHTTMSKEDIEPVIVADGWAPCLQEERSHAYVNTPGFGKTWMAYRDGDYNLIVVFNNERHFARCVAATELCKVLNLLDKGDRVSAHALVHLDTENETVMPKNYQLRSFIRDVKATDWWDYVPPPPAIPPALTGWGGFNNHIIQSDNSPPVQEW